VTGSIYVKGGTPIQPAYVIGTVSRITALHKYDKLIK